MAKEPNYTKELFDDERLSEIDRMVYYELLMHSDSADPFTISRTLNISIDKFNEATESLFKNRWMCMCEGEDGSHSVVLRHWCDSMNTCKGHKAAKFLFKEGLR